MTIAATLKRLSPPLYRLRVLVIIIAVLAVPFAIYYWLYVRSQTSYFSDRSFRKLSHISSQISLKVESAGSVLKNTSDKIIRPYEADSPSFDTKPGGKQQNLDRLKEAFTRLKDDSPKIIPINIDTEPWADKLSPQSLSQRCVKPGQRRLIGPTLLIRLVKGQ